MEKKREFVRVCSCVRACVCLRACLCVFARACVRVCGIRDAKKMWQRGVGKERLCVSNDCWKEKGGEGASNCL